MQLTRGIAFAGAAALLLAGCGQGSDSAASDTDTRGPITVWLSNNEQEVAWGKAVTEEWNALHPDEKVTAQEIPAGKSSEEAITAAITAGTTPCLVYNVSPAAVSGWVKQGGLVDLTEFSDGTTYIEERGGDAVTQYQSQDGTYHQLPWKSNPVMVMYNKDLFAKAGLDPEQPNMQTYDEFLAGARQIVSSGAAPSAIWPSPTSEFFQPWFDFYPFYIAQSDGKMLVEDGKSTFNDANGKAVADFWAQVYSEGLAPKEAATDDAMATGRTAMQIAGPWAIASYDGKVNTGFMPVPTLDGKTPEETKTFADAKSISMFASCEAKGTAWEFLKFTTSEEQDGNFLAATGQMPIRTDLPETYSDYFEANAAYTAFADQSARAVDVPNVPNSVEAWQKFRDQYSASVIFGRKSVDEALSTAAEEIDALVEE